MNIYDVITLIISVVVFTAIEPSVTRLNETRGMPIKWVGAVLQLSLLLIVLVACPFITEPYWYWLLIVGVAVSVITIAVTMRVVAGNITLVVASLYTLCIAGIYALVHQPMPNDAMLIVGGVLGVGIEMGYRAKQYFTNHNQLEW